MNKNDLTTCDKFGACPCGKVIKPGAQVLLDGAVMRCSSCALGMTEDISSGIVNPSGCDCEDYPCCNH